MKIIHNISEYCRSRKKSFLILIFIMTAASFCGYYSCENMSQTLRAVIISNYSSAGINTAFPVVQGVAVFLYSIIAGAAGAVVFGVAAVPALLFLSTFVYSFEFFLFARFFRAENMIPGFFILMCINIVNCFYCRISLRTLEYGRYDMRISPGVYIFAAAILITLAVIKSFVYIL